MAFRFFTLILIFATLFGLLGLNLYRLQVKKTDYYVERALARDGVAEAQIRRGQIFFTDKHGSAIPIALNRDYPFVYAVPKEIEDPGVAARILAPLVNEGDERLEKDFSNKNNLYRLLIDKASVNQVSEIKNSNLKGVYSAKKLYRFYPYGSLASHLLGFVGVNDENIFPTGLYGVEKIYNGDLFDGKDLNLTIDRNLQAQSEEILKSLVEKFGASGGTIIIEDPKTGKILTLANVPDFDPSEYSKSPVNNFLNPAVSFVYEPGSVFKPITMAAGIDSQSFTSGTTFYDSGSVTLNGKTINNWNKKVYGKVTMTNVIEQSINTGAVFAERLIGNEKFLNYLKNFGLGENSQIDLPDEVFGSLRNLEKKRVEAIDFATASFGQGTAVTPIQMVNAFSVLANGGLLMRPYINNNLKPYVLRRVISVEAARQVTEMMKSAVLKAQVASIPGYQIAGKTGTAQVPDFKQGGYTDELIHTYIGFAPTSDPHFVILIKLDKPQADLAGGTVVPAFKELAQFVLNYYNIAPDRLNENLESRK